MSTRQVRLILILLTTLLSFPLLPFSSDIGREHRQQKLPPEREMIFKNRDCNDRFCDTKEQTFKRYKEVRTLQRRLSLVEQLNRLSPVDDECLEHCMSEVSDDPSFEEVLRLKLGAEDVD